MKAKLFNRCVNSIEAYLTYSGWYQNAKTRLWTKEKQNKFTLTDAFIVQSNNDFKGD